ncbi:Mss4-like protein [Pterulicium gracile]|uniref:Mss4-like protein n=1 Tax=Pterulicium gracile TaxID=1884261 RepID=A0A5C3QGB9_9AGAR|nr:Mss4-like protein [Pterula gracilis]
MSDSPFKGYCFCKTVSWAASGSPALSVICHCTLCQRLHGAPFIHSIHFLAAQFQWTHAEPHEDYIEKYQVPEKPWKYRVRCKSCGVMVAGEHTKSNKFNVFVGGMERDQDGNVKKLDEVKATAHIFYDTRLMDVNDGLPKWNGVLGQSTLLSSA